MPKGYMLSAHRSEGDPVKRAAYLKTAVSALEAAGGKFLAKGGKVQARENGIAGSSGIYPKRKRAGSSYDRCS